MSDRDHAPERTTYLVAHLPAGIRLAFRNHFHVGSRNQRSSKPNSSKRAGAPSNRVAPIMAVAPSMEVARYKPKFRRDGARDTPRATIACPVSGKDLVPPSILRSQRTTAGMGPGLFLPSPHPDGRVSAASSWSLLSFWHRLREPPRVANVSSTALQRFLLWVCVAAPKDHARTWIASYLKLAPSLRRFEQKLYFHEADIASHRVTKLGGLRPSPFSMTCRSTGHAPGGPLPSLLSMCREVPRS